MNDNSHEILRLVFFEKLKNENKCRLLQILLGALRVNLLWSQCDIIVREISQDYLRLYKLHHAKKCLWDYVDRDGPSMQSDQGLHSLLTELLGTVEHNKVS